MHHFVLTKHVPDHEDKTEANDGSDDDGVPPLAEIDLVHQTVDQRKLAGQIIELGLNCLRKQELIDFTVGLMFYL